jgi:hypothetical protein
MFQTEQDWNEFLVKIVSRLGTGGALGTMW